MPTTYLVPRGLEVSYGQQMFSPCVCLYICVNMCVLSL